MPDTGGEIGLPPLLNHRAFNELSEWVDCLYWQYQAMLETPGIFLWGRQVTAEGSMAADGRPLRFWHLISDSRGSEVPRVLSTMRGAMLGGVWHVLELLAAGDPRACWWREESAEGSTLHVAPVDFSIEVILLERPGSFRLKTAYPHCGRRSRESRMSRAATSWQSGLSARDHYRKTLKRRPEEGPYRSPDAIERHRCWM